MKLECMKPIQVCAPAGKSVSFTNDSKQVGLIHNSVGFPCATNY